MFVLPRSCVIDKHGNKILTKKTETKKRKLVMVKCQYNWWVALPPKTLVPVICDNDVHFKKIVDVKIGDQIVLHAYPYVRDVDFLDWVYRMLRKATFRNKNNTFAVSIDVPRGEGMSIFVGLLHEGIFSLLNEIPTRTAATVNIKGRDILRYVKNPTLVSLSRKITNDQFKLMEERKTPGLRYTPSAYTSEYRKVIQDIFLAHQIRKRPKRFSEDYWRYLTIRSLYNQAVLGSEKRRYISKRNRRLLRQPMRLLGTMGHSSLARSEHSLQGKILHELSIQHERMFCLTVKEKTVSFCDAIDVGNNIQSVNGLNLAETDPYKLIKLSHVTYI